VGRAWSAVPFDVAKLTEMLPDELPRRLTSTARHILRDGQSATAMRIQYPIP
jgi:hypothetical protein